MSFLASLGLLGASSAMGMLGNAQQYSYSKRLMREQAKINMKLAAWSARQLPAMQRQGYVSAGYNPILAYGGNFASAGSVSVPSFDSQVGSQNLDSAMSASAALKQQEQQDKQVKLQEEKTEAEIDSLKTKSHLDKIKTMTEVLSSLGRGFVNMRNLSLASARNKREQEIHDGSGSVKIGPLSFGVNAPLKKGQDDKPSGGVHKFLDSFPSTLPFPFNAVHPINKATFDGIKKGFNYFKDKWKSSTSAKGQKENVERVNNWVKSRDWSRPGAL